MELFNKTSRQVCIIFLFGLLGSMYLYIPVAHADGNNYTITYNRNGGSGRIPKQIPESQATIFSLAPSTCIFKFGYLFDGWSDGTTRYAAGANYTVGSSDITLTAQWVINTKRVITYSIAGGSGTLPTPVAVQQGVSFTIPTGSGLTKVGFTFDGWSDGVNTYQPGDRYSIGTTKILFTAQWIPNP